MASEGGRGRILIVEDDQALARSMKRILGEYDVTIAVSGKAALDILRRKLWFHVILCDVMMPEMTGIELFTVVREELPCHAERFVFISGDLDTPVGRALFDVISNVRIEKPCSPDALRAVVQGFVQPHP